MPVDQLFSNTTTILRGPTSDTKLSNVDRTGKYQKPWGVRVCQVTNSQQFTNNVAATVGFDTLIYNTYQGLGDPTYSLTFTSATIGGHAYPYTKIVVADSGIYDVKCLLNIVIATAGAGQEFFTGTIQVNSVDRTDLTIEQAAFPSVTAQLSADGNDLLQLSKGDSVSVVALISNNAVGYTGNLINTSIATYLCLRYLGSG